MTNLIIAAAAFLLIHLLVSGTRLRDAIIRTIGQGPYMGLYSLASIALLIWMGFAYAAAQRGPNPVYWSATPVTKWIQLGVTLIAFLLAVPGLATRNPTSVAGEALLDRPNTVQGILRITRHPFLWGVALWAAGHLMVNGDLASLILFGSLFLLAVLGQFIFAITIAFFYGLTALRVDPQVWLQNLPNPFAAGNVMGDAVLAGLILCATAMTVAGALYLISRVRDAR